ncbi:MAG: VOC family protein [bacterium]|nr:VOC family protein [bacterium]
MHKLVICWFLAFHAMSSVSGAQESQASLDLRVDHFVFAINDFERGVRLLEDATGVKPAFGGRHPAMGTQNALISIGEGTYLEIISPDSSPASGNPFAGAMLARFQELTPMRWAVATHELLDLKGALEREGLTTSPIETGSRERPDGVLLEWKTMGVVDLQSPLVPFIIEWAEGSEHPSKTSPKGCTFRSLTFTHPKPDELAGVLGKLGVGANVKPGDEARFTLELECNGEAVRF